MDIRPVCYRRTNITASARTAAEIEAAVAGAVRIRIERDVGNAVAPRGVERLIAQMLLHDAEGVVAALAQARQVASLGL